MMRAAISLEWRRTTELAGRVRRIRSPQPALQDLPFGCGRSVPFVVRRGAQPNDEKGRSATGPVEHSSGYNKVYWLSD